MESDCYSVWYVLYNARRTYSRVSDRKYKQRGYMDDDSGGKRPRSTGPRERSDKPRGRGLGKPTKSVFRCSRCGRQEVVSSLSPETICSQCGEDLHTCTNCSHFDTSARYECREAIQEAFPKKSKRNDCELFSAKTTQEFESESLSPGDAKSEFDSLFDF